MCFIMLKHYGYSILYSNLHSITCKMPTLQNVKHKENAHFFPFSREVFTLYLGRKWQYSPKFLSWVAQRKKKKKKKKSSIYKGGGSTKNSTHIFKRYHRSNGVSDWFNKW